jgi:hypothetical protein
MQRVPIFRAERGARMVPPCFFLSRKIRFVHSAAHERSWRGNLRHFDKRMRQFPIVGVASRFIPTRDIAILGNKAANGK